VDSYDADLSVGYENSKVASTNKFPTPAVDTD
jgi:hypothetical protein